MKLFAIACIIFIGFTSCKKDKDKEFDNKAMLENIADNILLPEYTAMEASLVQLKTDANNFISDFSTEKLTQLRTTFLSAYKNVQRIKLFDFGPSSDYGLKAALNTYPTDTTKITNNITSGSYTLGSSGNIDAIGFPAIDYLLFSGEDSEVLARFSTENARNYLIELIDKMMSEMAAVHNEWKSNYRTTFVTATGTDVGSSISFLFNELLKDLELLKNPKIGIPVGQFSGGMPFPNYVEAYYSSYSKELALESANSLKNLYLGGSGQSFDDYMKFKAEEESQPVSSATVVAQFDVCIAKIEALNTPFSTAISSNPAPFKTAFQELKRLVAYMKVDVAASLGLLITYSDTDGD